MIGPPQRSSVCSGYTSIDWYVGSLANESMHNVCACDGGASGSSFLSTPWGRCVLVEVEKADRSPQHIHSIFAA